MGLCLVHFIFLIFSFASKENEEVNSAIYNGVLSTAKYSPALIRGIKIDITIFKLLK